ncbi:oxidoreductase [Solihabitans fulvus]|uniref:Oxidoreductase n=1 Tax=Solihabitans fulvus TaxID=1892852 RepID=A0A5B2XG64_9PSEU|nr:oxidoreductase [Solihabitans fulvus]KAA2262266.1 oxidoreductase [Solihabitans fulvus]
MTDPLAQLLDLPGVTDAVKAARDAVGEVHRHPTNRRGWPTTAAEASVRAARASAALDGGPTDIPADGEVTDPVLAGALRVAESLGLLLTTWQRAPLQALARLHVLAAADLVPAGQSDLLGRPRQAPGVATRLDLLAGLVAGGTSVPGPLLAAVVHGELLALNPFEQGGGVVARAASRLTSIATGLDPKGLAVPEVAYLRRGPAYPAAAAAFAEGTPEGVGGWLVFCCEAIVAGAREATSIADAAAAG